MSFSFVMVLTLLCAGAEFPQTDAGRRSAAFVAAFNAGEEAMRAFEAEHRSEAALRERGIEDRIAAYRSRRAQWGKLTLLRVVAESEAQLVAHVGTSESGEILEFRFLYEETPSRKLIGIQIQPLDELGAPRDPELREELLRRLAEDQSVRTKSGIVGWEILKVDAANLPFLKDLIGRRGWPGKTLVGVDGAQAAWLLVQHADGDRAFQRKCLELLCSAQEKGEATAEQVAYLTDRVLVGERKPQQYGTQFHTVNGELIPLPIEDEARVDERRKTVGLGPLAEYAQQLKAIERNGSP